MQSQEHFEVTATGFVAWIHSAVCFGLSFHHASSMVQFYAWVGILAAKRGNAFVFFALGITLPQLLSVLKQFALESAEQQC